VFEPKAERDRMAFAVRERYLAADGKRVAEGETGLVVRAPAGDRSEALGTLLLWRTEIRAGDEALVFGAQHEMGLGFRVATPLVVKGGTGTILASHGGVNEKGVWGKRAQWWDYSGRIGSQRAGILAAVPSAGRAFWAHARDYGFLAINPTGPPPDGKDAPPLPFHVEAGQSVTFRFALLLHASPAETAWDPGKAAVRMQEWLEAEGFGPSP
jgi:hypothetical protein